jgi:hypothetical protein
LHVWAWEHNPKGAFADWNTRVASTSGSAEPRQSDARRSSFTGAGGADGSCNV